MENKTIYIILGIFSLLVAIFLVVGGVLLERMEFALVGMFICAPTCGECIRRSKR